jgi:Tfp pilus assembly protein PilX
MVYVHGLSPRGHAPTRRGNALIVTMIVMASLAGLFCIAADNVLGQSVITQADLDRQRATYAAESLAAMIEAKLHERAADLRNLKVNIDEDPSAWWDLRGCSYTRMDANGNEVQVNPDRGLWINGCVVRWRLEPVKIYNKTLAPGESPNGATYTVNPEPDPNLDSERTDASLATDPNNTLSDQNEFYHYRIVTEAYALTNNEDADAQPWDNPGERRCSVQAQRISQLKVLCLFKYALFYAGEGPTGDISSLGFQQIFDGSVHSNGAVYCGGKSLGGQYWWPNAPQFHMMCSGEWPSQPGLMGTTCQNTNLGTAAKKITVTGADGVFRECKWANYFAVQFNAPFASKNPWAIPTDSNVFPERRFILNSDVPGDPIGYPYKFAPDRVRINGIIFPPERDSRMALDLQSRFNNRVRDKNNNGKVVKTLANFPALSGRPLEHQRLGQRGLQLYEKPDGTKTSSPRGALALYYSSNPSTQVGAASVQTAPPTMWPVPIEDMPVYWDANYENADVSVPPFQDNDFSGVTTSGDGFSDREAKGFYLEKALFGKNVTSKMYYTSLPNPPLLTSTGLVFREKPTQNPVLPKPSPSNLAAYADYMKSQYNVLFAGHNITDQFFGSMVQPVVATDWVWVDDALPAGAIASTTYDVPTLNWFGQTGYHEEAWKFFSAYSGTSAVQFASNPGYHQQYFFDATDTLTVNAGDNFVCYVYLEPSDKPLEIGVLLYDNAGACFGHWGPDWFGWGVDCGALPAAGTWARLEVPASVLGMEGRTFSGLQFVMIGGTMAWDRIGTQATVWVDDALPAGAVVSVADPWTEVFNLAWGPEAYSGAVASPSDLGGNIHQHYFYNAAQTLQPASGEKLFAYVYLDPANLPQQLMLQYYVADATSWEHRIYWGVNNGSTAGSLAYMGALPAAGQWVRLEFPAALLTLENKPISGFAFTMFGGGRGSIDKIGMTAVQTELMVSEDEFVNMRESGYMASFYGLNPRDFPAGSNASYKITTLTLNLRMVQDFLRTKLLNEDLGMSEFPLGTRAKLCFNGLIYAHRTRRSQSYHPLNHPELFWDPYTRPNVGKYSVLPYMAGQYPYQVREGDGPPETFHAGVRIRGGLSKDGSERGKHAEVDWAHDVNNDGVNDACPLGTSGLTIATPNHLYLWGDFNTVDHPDAGGTMRTSPCAVMCDMNTKLSANWIDGTKQVYDNSGTTIWNTNGATYKKSEPACTTSYICSFVSNNIPCDDWNLLESGEYGGFIQDCTTLECWRNPTGSLVSGFTIQKYRGSYVVLNSTRYTKALHSYTPNGLNNQSRVSETDVLDMRFNSDLFTQAGQPPFSPYGVEVTSVVNTINVLDN